MEDFLRNAERLVAEAAPPNALSQATRAGSGAFHGGNTGRQEALRGRDERFRTPDRDRQRPVAAAGSPSSGRRRLGSASATPGSASPRRMPSGVEEISIGNEAMDEIEPGLLHANNLRMAALHATRLRDLPNTLMKEVELLFKMLQYDDSADSLREHPPVLDLPQCAPYAVAVLVRCEALLRAFGPQVCGALASRNAVKVWAPKLTRSLQKRSEDLSPRDAHSIALTQVPFMEATDAAQHFKKHPERRRAYENREAVREQFLEIITMRISPPNETFKAYTPDDAAQNKAFIDCVQNIIPENLAWFANLFVQTMVNSSRDDRAFDPSFVGWAEQRNILNHVNKLARRTEASLTPSAGSSSMLEELFPLPAERFFPLFVSVVDSHALSSNLILVCHSRLLKLSFEATSEPLGERISTCSILAKFLAFLVHSPFFSSSKLAFEHKNQSSAFEEQHNEAVGHAERAGFRGVDCVTVLWTTLEDAPELLPIIVPWVIRYLITGPLRDETSRAAQSTLVIVRMLRTLRGQKQLFRSAIKQGNGKAGFAFMRMLCDLDYVLNLDPVKSIATEEVFDETDKFGESLSDFARQMNSYGAFFSEFDAVPVDNVATSCIPLKQLRQILLITSGSGTIRRRVDELKTVSAPPSATPLQAVQTTMVVSTEEAQERNSRSNNPPLDELVRTCLHNEASLARTCEFASKTAPKVVAAQMQWFISSSVMRGAEASTLDDIADREDILIEGICARSFPYTKQFVDGLVNLSFVHESQTFKYAVTRVLLVKVEEEVEKTLRNKVTEIFQARAEKLRAASVSKRKFNAVQG